MAKKSENKIDSVLSKESDSQPSYYVGIGASAGGLEAIEEFFKQAPEDAGMAYVVIQHLSPTHKSMMVELLSRHTEMPVLRAEDGMDVERDTIYLIPPNKTLSIFHDKLLLSEVDHSRELNLPIDIFFRSLAEDQGEKAIAIVLSGTGSDGTRGLRNIKEKLGMVMVQEPSSAKFDGMPKSAIATGLCDYILPPNEMPGQLMEYAKHPYASRSKISETVLTDEDGLTRIFYQLREKTAVDFTLYKPSTLVRRIERRMLVNQMHDLPDYVRFLESNQTEVMTLYREMLIGVTSFFRDSKAYELLEKTFLPELIRKKEGQELRIWVAGCSTGEEAYSLAMLCHDCIERLEISVKVKIFATDVDRDAIIRAGNGVYPQSIAADVPDRLLARYFYRHEDSYHIIRQIREMVVFAQQNLVKDPPFTNMDMVTCRNLLIYLQPILQRKALEMFNFSLRPEGILFLGASETTGEMFEYFESLDNKWKIFRSRGKRRERSLTDADSMLYRKTITSMPYSSTPLPRSYSQRLQEEERILDRLLQSITGSALTLALAVNEQMELQYVAGDTDGFFKLPSGKIENNIAKMAVKDLSIPLSTGIQKAFAKGEEVLYSNISIEHRNGPKVYDMRVKQLAKKKGQAPLVGVFLNENRKIPVIEENGDASHVYDVSKEAQQRIIDLEQSLQFHKENLQATVEELETSNEELQATNEELMASNEELQSTNEELQSVNEELYTVNAEYQSKIVELTEANNDLENLNASTNIATVFLDENFDIRKFTPAFSTVYKIIESDAGRPFSHLSHYLHAIDPYEVVKSVARDGGPVEMEVEHENGNTYFMRVLPYYIAPEVYSGVVLSFIDVSPLKAESHERRLINAVLNGMVDGLVVCDSSGVIRHVNPTACKIFGYAEKDLLGQSVNILMFEKEANEHDKHIARQMSSGKHVNACGQDVTGRHQDGSSVDLHITLSESFLEGNKYFTAVIRRQD
ncbi:chemotaxis protein CheB [Mariprofundus sp. NF]|uniref:chemotaxis protein CheB n=1 Tax=Mariprofundus sp. NF TaxID=2608716 RepID=UPI0015A03576|nr:chemotaxis protein CheB [Mariprofundus sp. NF]